MAISFFVSLLFLCLLNGALFLKRSVFVYRPKKIILAVLVGQFVALAIQWRNLVFSWIEAGPPSQYLLPPYASLKYSLAYGWTHIFSSFVLSLFFALFLFGLAKIIPKSKREMIFEKEELFFIFLSVFLLGHPFWLVFLAMALLTYLLLFAYFFAKLKKQNRISFYYLWLPLALAIKIASPLLTNSSILTSATISI